MKKWIITAETTCDLSPEILKERNFKTIPINVILGVEELQDGENVTAEQLFEYVAKTGTLPKTAAG